MSENGSAPQLYSVDAERSVLGSILIDPPALHEVSDRLRPRHFRIASNRAIYKAMLSLDGGDASIDFVSLAEALERGDVPAPEGDWHTHMITLLNTVPTSVNVDTYARIVTDYGKRRQLLAAAQKIARLAGDTDVSSGDVLSQATDLVLGVQRENDSGKVLSPRQYVQRFLDDLEQESEDEVLPTPLVGWNQLLLGGLRKPFAHFIAARPKMGKSALCMHLVAHLTVNMGKSVFFATTEMSDLQFTRRAVTQLTGVPMDRLMKRSLSTKERSKVLERSGILGEKGPYLDVTAELTPLQIRARAMRMAGRRGLDLIVVDHLHEMVADSPTNKRHLELGAMARSLRDTAKALDVPIVIVAQLNRNAVSRGVKVPQLSDFREAGALEETAYSVTFIHREHYYDETADEEQAQIKLAAHRDGPTGTVDVKWNAPLMRFENLTKEQGSMVPGRNGDPDPTRVPF